jgi:hypothetical protein
MRVIRDFYDALSPSPKSQRNDPVVEQDFIADGTGDQVKVGSRARLLDRGSASQLLASIDAVNNNSRNFWSM